MIKKGLILCVAILAGAVVGGTVLTGTSKTVMPTPAYSNQRTADALSGATDLSTPEVRYYQPRELIQVSNDSVVMAYNQAEAEVFVTAQSPFELYYRSPWLSVKQSGDKLTLTAQQNEAFLPRIARIYLTTKKENITRVITVTQKAEPSHDQHFSLPAGDNIYPMTQMDLSKATHDSWIKAISINKSIEGRKVKVKGNTYQATLSTHAASVFKVRLNGATRFVCDLGIDDEVLLVSDPSTHGNASYKVLLDGKTVAEGNLLLSDNKAVHLDIDTSCASEMELQFGTNGSNWGDHVDLCNPYFVVSGEKPVLID